MKPILLALGLSAWVGIALGQGLTHYESWIAPSPESQIFVEGRDDRKGLGRIFVPAMTSQANEPLYAVFQDDSLISEQPMGTSVFLIPGHYTVLLGTGNIEQRIHREVEVLREATVILDPTWAALTIEVIDETRNYYKQDMQVFLADNAQSYGLVPAIDPELGEQLQTLILRPGLYKIVRRGEDFNTYVNFITVTLEPGRYTPLTIVMDSQSGKYVGAGIITSKSRTRQNRDWKLFGAIHGNLVINSANNSARREISSNYSLLTQIDNSMVYEKLPHYYQSRNLLDLGALQPEGAKLAISQDRFQSKNTYVYYLVKWLGGYSRLEVSTHMFPAVTTFDAPKNIGLRDIDGNLTSHFGITRLTTQPAFYPLNFKEGFGVNVTPLRSFFARLSVRAGLGYWQVYNHGVYSQDAAFDTLYAKIGNSYPQGFETSLVSNFAILSNLTITTEVDMLFPFEKQSRTVFDIENFISIGLTKNISLEHTLRLKQEPSFDYTVQEQFISIRLSYFFF